MGQIIAEKIISRKVERPATGGEYVTAVPQIGSCRVISLCSPRISLNPSELMKSRTLSPPQSSSTIISWRQYGIYGARKKF